nr:Protein F55D12.5, isoform a [Haemonchus contortus]
MSLKALIFVALIGTAHSLRCQCSSEAGGVRCYNGWCDVQDFGGKVGACALVRVGTRQHFACVRVKPTSEDSCKVEQRNGETLVRCWCRNQDYCNTDLSDRVDDDKELPPENLVADEHDEESETAADNVREDIVIERNYDLKDEDYLNKYDSDGSSEDDDLYPPLPHHHPTTTTTTTTTTTSRPAVVTTTFPPWRREYPAEQPDSLRPQYSMRQLEQPRPEYPALQPVRRPEYPASRQEQPPQPPPVPPLPPQPDPYELRRQMEEERRRRIQEHYDRYQEHLKAFEARRMEATFSSTTTTTTSTTTTSTSVAVPTRPVFSETAVQQRTEDRRPDSRRLSLEELERQRHEEMLRREQERIMERARAQAEARARLIKPNVTQPRAWIKVPSGEEKPADDRPPPPVLPFRRYRPFDLNVVTTKQVVSTDDAEKEERKVATTTTPRPTTTKGQEIDEVRKIIGIISLNIYYHIDYITSRVSDGVVGFKSQLFDIAAFDDNSFHL